METVNKKNIDNIDDFNVENEIDILQIYNFLQRNRKVIFITSLVGFLVGAIYSLSIKREWTGRFQIVLSEGKGKSKLDSFRRNLPPNINVPITLGGFSKGVNPLETEVEILKSSSVLMPVFDFVKKEYAKQGIDTETLRYSGWQKQLQVSLKKGTSVLDLSYEDTNKELIIPVLDMISKEYQDYSRKDRIKGIEKGLIYLDEQIKIFKDKSLESFREARQFALDNSMTSNLTTSLGFEMPINNPKQKKDIIELKDEIKFFANQKEKLERLNGDEIVAFTINLEEMKNSFLLRKIIEIENALIKRSTLYTENDEKTKYYENLRNSMINKLKNNTLNYLQEKINISKSLIDSLKRPDPVVIKYNELTRIATRDNFSLNSLENNRRLLAIDQARSTEPWELISLPTIDSLPSGPPRKIITLFLASIGFLIGASKSFFDEKNKGFVYSSNVLKTLTPYTYLGDLSTTNKNKWEEEIKTISKIKFPNVEKEKIYILPLIDESFADRNLLLKTFKEITNIFEVKNIKTSQIPDLKKQILIVGPGLTKKEELLKLIRENNLLNNQVLGWVQVNTKYVL